VRTSVSADGTREPPSPAPSLRAQRSKPSSRIAARRHGLLRRRAPRIDGAGLLRGLIGTVPLERVNLWDGEIHCSPVGGCAHRLGGAGGGCRPWQPSTGALDRPVRSALSRLHVPGSGRAIASRWRNRLPGHHQRPAPGDLRHGAEQFILDDDQPVLSTGPDAIKAASHRCPMDCFVAALPAVTESV
jgi:hypothetical protein